MTRQKLDQGLIFVASLQLELQFGSAINSGLFSTHWLKHRLQLEPEWEQLRTESNAVLEVMGSRWKKDRSRVHRSVSEQDLEYAFIQPVFESLGWKLTYQTFLQGRKPDYALFQSDEDLDAAIALGKNHPDFWQYATLVADAKSWNASLDRSITATGHREFPPQQMESYLTLSGVSFGILTNGTQWRLVARERQPFQGRFDTYFEFRLSELLDYWNSKEHLLQKDQLQDEFLQFFLFFSPRGFLAAPGRESLVTRAVSGSSEYRLGIGDDLRDRAFDAVRLCIQGLLDSNKLNPDEYLERCRSESLIETKACSNADIERLQAKAGASLPGSYVEFLRLIGRGAGEFMSDLKAFYPAVLTTRRSVPADQLDLIIWRRRANPMRRKHNRRTHAASSVPDVLGCFDRSLEVRLQLFEDEVGVCDIVAGEPPDSPPDRPTTLTFGDEVVDLSSLLTWLTQLAGRDAWTFYVHHHDNIVVDLALLEPYRQAGFCRRLRLFRTNPADEGGTNLLGVSAPDRAWVLVLNNDNQGKFRIDFFGPAPLCHSLRSHLG